MRKITLPNGETYIHSEDVETNERPSGDRSVVIADRGFIYGGDVEQAERAGLSGVLVRDAVIVRKWTSEATWAGVLNGPHEGVTLDRLRRDVFVPGHAVVSIVPVEATWAK